MKRFALLLLQTYMKILSYVSPERASQKAQKLFFTPRKHTSKVWELDALATAKNVMLDDNIQCSIWGNENEKSILLMHGWEGRASQMAVFLPLLAQKYKLIAVNAPAHGDSSGKMSHPGKFVEAIFTAQEKFGPFYAIIGHSMGGGCAVYSAMETLNVQKVISIAGPSNFEFVVKSFAQFIGLRGKALSIFMANTEADVQLPFSKVNLANRVSTFDKPLLIIHDENDLEIPFAESQKYQANINNGEFFATQGLGHRKIMQSEQVLQKVADFLES